MIEATGTSRGALRSYAKDGALGKVMKSGPGGRQLFTEDQVEYVWRRVKFREAGLSPALVDTFAAEGLPTLPGRPRAPTGLLEQQFQKLKIEEDERREAADVLKSLLAARL